MDKRPLTLIEISGPPRARGRQYGEAAREQIMRSLAFYQHYLAHTTQLEWSVILERAPRWIPLIEDYLPEAVDEMIGIAEGANCALEEILALNSRGELASGERFLDEQEGCSSLAIAPEASGDGHVYAAMNWDWLAEVADTVVILRVHQPAKPTVITQVEAGQIARHGVNSYGIALNANGLGVRFGSGLGIPQTCIRRRILDSASIYDALCAIFGARQSGCTNLLLTHRDGFVIDLETTPGRHGWMYPTNGILVHGNHFIAFVPPQIAGSYRPWGVDSLYRVPRIEQALRRTRDVRTPEAMRELIASALRDHFGKPASVCCHPDERFDPYHRYETVASSIIDLTSGEYYVALGQPCQTEYQRLPWDVYSD